MASERQIGLPQQCARYRETGRMPSNGAIIFRDLIGKLEVLRVSCEKCGRDGRYIMARLIRQRGARQSSSIGSMN
jgi:hypothetical protein